MSTDKPSMEMSQNQIHLAVGLASNYYVESLSPTGL